jgi:hypothetical protein
MAWRFAGSTRYGLVLFREGLSMGQYSMVCSLRLLSCLFTSDPLALFSRQRVGWRWGKKVEAEVKAQ